MPAADIESLIKACRSDPACGYSEMEKELVMHNVSTRLPTEDGTFNIHLFTDSLKKEHLALVKGNVKDAANVLCRVHSECLTGDLFGSLRCDCGPQLHHAMRMIEEEDTGLILYLRQEGRGIGLLEKLKTYNLQDQGLDTVDANVKLGHKAEERKYDTAARMLEVLGVSSIRLLSNNPDKVRKLEELGVSITERIPIEPKVNRENLRYLTTKVERMGHILDTDELYPFLPEIDEVIRYLRRSMEKKKGAPFFTVLNLRTFNSRYPDLETRSGERENTIKVLKERIASLHEALLLGPDDLERYRGFTDLIGPIRKVLIFDPTGEVNLSHPEEIREELDLCFLHTGNLLQERIEEIESDGFMCHDISNGRGRISLERVLDLFPVLGISSVITEGTNDMARFLLDRNLADGIVQLMLPVFEGKEVDDNGLSFEMKDPRTVMLGDTAVYFSST